MNNGSQKTLDFSWHEDKTIRADVISNKQIANLLIKAVFFFFILCYASRMLPDAQIVKQYTPQVWERQDILEVHDVGPLNRNLKVYAAPNNYSSQIDLIHRVQVFSILDNEQKQKLLDINILNLDQYTDIEQNYLRFYFGDIHILDSVAYRLKISKPQKLQRLLQQTQNSSKEQKIQNISQLNKTYLQQTKQQGQQNINKQNAVKNPNNKKGQQGQKNKNQSYVQPDQHNQQQNPQNSKHDDQQTQKQSKQQAQSQQKNQQRANQQQQKTKKQSQQQQKEKKQEQEKQREKKQKQDEERKQMQQQQMIKRRQQEIKRKQQQEKKKKQQQQQNKKKAEQQQKRKIEQEKKKKQQQEEQQRRKKILQYTNIRLQVHMKSDFATILELIIRYISVLVIIYMATDNSDGPLTIALICGIISNPLLFLQISYPNKLSNIIDCLCKSGHMLYFSLWVYYIHTKSKYRDQTQYRVYLGLKLFFSALLFVLNFMRLLHYEVKIVQTLLVIVVIFILSLHLWDSYLNLQYQHHRDKVLTIVTLTFLGSLFSFKFLSKHWKDQMAFIIYQIYGLVMLYLMSSPKDRTKKKINNGEKANNNQKSRRKRKARKQKDQNKNQQNRLSQPDQKQIQKQQIKSDHQIVHNMQQN